MKLIDLFSASYRIKINYKLGKLVLNRFGNRGGILIKYLQFRQNTKFNCDISYSAKITGKISFPHPIGIVIGKEVVIGNNVKIFQQVTLGGKPANDPKYPIIEDNVTIYPGAKIIGGIIIGEGSTIAANAVVLKDVPKGKTAVGIPAKII